MQYLTKHLQHEKPETLAHGIQNYLSKVVAGWELVGQPIIITQQTAYGTEFHAFIFLQRDLEKRLREQPLREQPLREQQIQDGKEFHGD